MDFSASNDKLEKQQKARRELAKAKRAKEAELKEKQDRIEDVRTQYETRTAHNNTQSQDQDKQNCEWQIDTSNQNKTNTATRHNATQQGKAQQTKNNTT